LIASQTTEISMRACGPRLARLGLDLLDDVRLVVQQPVAQRAQPLRPAAGAERLPRRLLRPHPADGGVDLGRGPDRHGTDDLAGRRVAHLDALGEVQVSGHQNRISPRRLRPANMSS
jgi:hypothetical protein